MTDDIIAKAAEIVGWKWDTELEAYLDFLGAGFTPAPTGPDRADLHVLCGMLEDGVREQAGASLVRIILDRLDVGWYCCITHGTRTAVESDLYDDPVMARLTALVELAEELTK